MMLREHPWAILIILLLIVLLFGSSKLPDLARNLGRSMRIVKKEVREMKDDDEDATPAAPTNPSAPTAPQQAAEPQQSATPQQPAGPAGDDAPKA